MVKEEIIRGWRGRGSLCDINPQLDPSTPRHLHPLVGATPEHVQPLRSVQERNWFSP